MRSLRSVAFACLACACGHSSGAESTPVATPAISASATSTSSAPAPTASASVAPTTPTDQGMFCESDSPRMPVDPSDSQTACWYAGASCTGHGGHEGEQFAVTGTVVAGSFIHGGCNPGSYALVYEPNTSPLRVRVCAKRSPPTKCPAMIHDGAKWDVAPLLQANHATAVTIVKP